MLYELLAHDVHFYNVPLSSLFHLHKTAFRGPQILANVSQFPLKSPDFVAVTLNEIRIGLAHMDELFLYFRSGCALTVNFQQCTFFGSFIAILCSA